MILYAAALLGQATPVAEAGVRIAGDWASACDNTGACAAVPLAPARRGGAAPFPLRIVREPGVAIRLTVPLGPVRGARFSLAVDGAAVATLVAPGGGGGLALPLDGVLRARLASGRALVLADARGRAVARASLAGLDATLAQLDATTAAPLPAIEQPAVTTKPPRRLSAKDAAKLAGAACTTPITARLDAMHTLAAVTCGGTRQLYVVDEKGRGAPAGDESSRWDGARRRLLSHTTDATACETRDEHAWDGAAFRLAERVVTPCRAAGATLVTWRARVVVR